MAFLIPFPAFLLHQLTAAWEIACCYYTIFWPVLPSMPTSTMRGELKRTFNRLFVLATAVRQNLADTGGR